MVTTAVRVQRPRQVLARVFLAAELDEDDLAVGPLLDEEVERIRMVRPELAPPIRSRDKRVVRVEPSLANGVACQLEDAFELCRDGVSDGCDSASSLLFGRVRMDQQIAAWTETAWPAVAAR